jgi:hypothetical protein
MRMVSGQRSPMKSKRRRRGPLTSERLHALIEKYPVVGIVYGPELLELAVVVSRAAERGKKANRSKRAR